MFKRNILKRLLYLAMNADLEATRLWLGIGAIIWGLFLLEPGSTFARPTYTVMAKFASEATWGSLFLFQGVLQVYTLIKGASSKTTLVLDAGLGCILWTGSCICMLMSIYPLPAAISAEISAAIASWWVLVRYKVGGDR